MIVTAHSPTRMPKITMGQWEMVPVTTVMPNAVTMIAVTKPGKPGRELRMPCCFRIVG